VRALYIAYKAANAYIQQETNRGIPQHIYEAPYNLEKNLEREIYRRAWPHF